MNDGKLDRTNRTPEQEEEVAQAIAHINEYLTRMDRRREARAVYSAALDVYYAERQRRLDRKGLIGWWLIGSAVVLFVVVSLFWGVVTATWALAGWEIVFLAFWLISTIWYNAVKKPERPAILDENLE